MAVQRHQAPAFAIAEVVVTVQGDRCPVSFHPAHLIPELRVRLRMTQIIVLIVWDHGENGLDCKLFNQRQYSLPSDARDSGTEVVEAK
jgi:hypothetical protein